MTVVGPAAALRGNPVRARVEVGGCGLGDVPDHEARTRRRLVEVERRQKSVSAAVRQSSEPRVMAKAALGFWAAAGARIGFLGCGAGRFKGRAGDFGRASLEEGRGSLGRGSRAVARRGRREEGDDRWDPLVSGGASSAERAERVLS